MITRTQSLSSHKKVTGMFETLLLASGTFWASVKAYQALKQKVVWRPRRRVSQGERANAHVHKPPLSSTAPTTQQEQKSMMVAAASLILTTAGALLYPPLSLVALPPLLYLTTPAIRKSYAAFVYEERVSFALVNVTIPALCLLNGYYVALALNFFVTSGGRYLLAAKREQAQQQIHRMFCQLPPSIQIECHTIEVEIPLAAVKPGDLVIVNSGQLIPVDGTIMQGVALVREPFLTCATQPAQKNAGDTVFAATLVVVGKLWINAEKVATATAAAQIHALINATAQQADNSQADQMTLPTLGIGALAAFLLNPVSAIALLHARLGYDLDALLPVGRLHFLHASLKEGVLVTNPARLPVLARVDTLVLSYSISRQLETGAVIRALRDDGLAFVYLINVPATVPPTQVARLAVDDLFYENAAQEPAAVIAQLQAAGHCVCYVGDGLVDAAAMRQADVGVSLRGLTDLAANEAQVILLAPDLRRLRPLLRAAAAFQQRVETTASLTYAPGLLTLAGVIFLQTGIYNAILVNQIGLLLGLHQTPPPLPAKRMHNDQTEAEPLGQVGFA